MTTSPWSGPRRRSHSRPPAAHQRSRLRVRDEVCGEGQKPISYNADHYPSRERSGRHLRQSTTDRMRIDPRNSLHESVPSVPQEFEVRATKIYPSRYCRNHSKKSDVVGYVIDDGHHFLAPYFHRGLICGSLSVCGTQWSRVQDDGCQIVANNGIGRRGAEPTIRLRQHSVRGNCIVTLRESIRKMDNNPYSLLRRKVLKCKAPPIYTALCPLPAEADMNVILNVLRRLHERWAGRINCLDGMATMVINRHSGTEPSSVAASISSSEPPLLHSGRSCFWSSAKKSWRVTNT